MTDNRIIPEDVENMLKNLVDQGAPGVYQAASITLYGDKGSVSWSSDNPNKAYVIFNNGDVYIVHLR